MLDQVLRRTLRRLVLPDWFLPTMQVSRSKRLISPESSMLRYLKMRNAVSCIVGSSREKRQCICLGAWAANPNRVQQLHRLQRCLKLILSCPVGSRSIVGHGGTLVTDPSASIPAVATADFELQRAGRGPGGETVTGAFGTLRKQLI